MPKLSAARRAERRDQIAAAALRCFARQGFANTSMADIIAEAGLSSGSIYSHFESKADLLRFTVSSVLEERFRAMIDDVRDGSEVSPSRLLARVLGNADVSKEQGSVLLQVWAEVPRDPELAALMGENLTKLRALIADALQTWVGEHHGDLAATQAADAVLAGLFGFVVRVALDPQTRPAEIRDGILAGFHLETISTSHGPAS